MCPQRTFQDSLLRLREYHRFQSEVLSQSVGQKLEMNNKNCF